MQLVVRIVHDQALEYLARRAVVGAAPCKQGIERRLLGGTADHEIGGKCGTRRERDEHRCNAKREFAHGNPKVASAISAARAAARHAKRACGRRTRYWSPRASFARGLPARQCSS